jgi:hypothetical protein
MQSGSIARCGRSLKPLSDSTWHAKGLSGPHRAANGVCGPCDLALRVLNGRPDPRASGAAQQREMAAAAARAARHQSRRPRAPRTARGRALRPARTASGVKSWRPS